MKSDGTPSGVEVFFQLLIPLTILVMLTGIVFTCLGVIIATFVTKQPSSGYQMTVLMTQIAVSEYRAGHIGKPMPHSSSYNVTIGNTTITGDVIDICAIVSEGIVLKKVPDGCYGNMGQANTNFFSGGCSNPTNGHYIWVMDQTSGFIYSICDENQDGIYSDTDRVDGQHGDIWP